MSWCNCSAAAQKASLVSNGCFPKKCKFYIIENVPARVDLETGEQFFSPQTVERLQYIIWEDRQPVRVIQTPVFEFA
jgi:hypothetical protein